jgi:long-chain fatty acid transport protein
MTELPRSVDFNLVLALPESSMDTSRAPAGNGVGNVTSDSDPILLPSAALVIPTGWLNDKIYLGTGIFSVAGFGLDYSTSRIGLALGPNINTYDKYSSYGVLKIVQGGAYKINDQWSVGLNLQLDHATFASDSAQPLAAARAQTSGANRTDGAFGFGFGVGILYKPCDFLSAGVSYISEHWMQDFERYKDILPNGLNLPQQVVAGISVTPIEKLLVSTDFRWINWGGATGGFGTSVANNGLGWQDQYIAMLGAQYQLFDFMKLRAGYNYGSDNIPNGSVFASTLAGAIGRHHLGGGLGFKLGDKMHMDVSYVRTLSVTRTDDGSSNPLAANAKISQSANQGSVQLGIQF